MVAFLVTLSLVSPVLAHESDSSESSLRGNKIENTCENITKRIDKQIEKWDDNEPGKHKGYTAIVTKVQNIIKRLEGKGYDLTDLKSALQNLNDAILKRHTDAQVLNNLLKDTKQYACGDSEGKFKEAMEKIKDQWKVVHADTMEIRNIWQNQVRPEIRKLKAQKPTITPVTND